MSKIKKTFQALQNIAQEPSLLNLVINDNESRKKEFVEKYPHLKSLPQIDFTDLDEDFDESVDLAFLDGGSLPTDLVLLKTLAKGKNSYFEIGTWRGESVWNIAKIINDCTTFNLSKEEINTLGLDKRYAELHGIISKKNPDILHLEGNSKTFDFQDLNKKYDLIFIDGDHSYEMVKNDTEKVFENLVHENSVVVWHDYAFNPEKVRYEVFKGILDGLPTEFHSKIYHVANTMCAVYIKENFTTKEFEELKSPDFLFEVNLKIKK
ncbi:class I SAM-dependent methyltransferase [Chryseobacterium luquanense]|uniref:Class I SAM-dependent methyltransferase n=1 Tax=Chryseobacterium luquanense TaxID=2983766 RepID=A0ABT3Y852_9FLAO|nr:class I SAM-dependent methyltransferase [Chryseobacterium luquanense]MCX8534293.1 class I SAM-dependent methyltransferase [Chryseobacterium luquanense]